MTGADRNFINEANRIADDNWQKMFDDISEGIYRDSDNLEDQLSVAQSLLDALKGGAIVAASRAGSLWVEWSGKNNG